MKTGICQQCHKEFEYPHSSSGKFCSKECASKYRMNLLKDDYEAGLISDIRTLKRHFIRYNKYECAICKTSEWNHKPLVLILDHIDGNSENNLPSNLRLVCPNCDSQLSTYKNRNKGLGRSYRRQRYKEGKSY